MHGQRYIRMSRRDLASALLGISVAVIVWMTILSRDATTVLSFSPPLHTFVSLTRNLQRGIRGNLLGNILLFIPVGLFLPIVWDNKMWRIVGAGTALSLLIEITQLITHRGMLDLDDVILNTIGTAVGYCLFVVIKKLISVNGNKISKEAIHKE